MQLPPHEEIVMVSGHAPVRAQKLRYFDDQNFQGRMVPPPVLDSGTYLDRPASRPDDWSQLSLPTCAQSPVSTIQASDVDDGGLHRHPDIAEVPDDERVTVDDLLMLDESVSPESRDSVENARQLRRVTRLASLDPSDGLSL
jgi:type IV secretion system protein VirD4